MIITDVQLVGRSNIILPMANTSPIEPFICKGVDGLGPSKRNVVIKNGYYQGSEVTSKQVVIQVGLNPNYSSGQTPESLRNTLYGLLSPNDTDLIEVQLMNGTAVVGTLQGVVESIDPVIFAKDPTVQIVILGLEGYFEAEEDTVLGVPAGTAAEWTVPYVGTFPTGFMLHILIGAIFSGLSITRGSASMTLEGDFTNDDEIVIDTRKGSSGVRRVAPTTANLIGELSADSSWLKLYPGDNLFTSDAGVDEFTFVSAATYKAKYWGV